MPLGMKVGLGPGDFVLDGDPAPPKRGTPPIFGPCLLWLNGRPSQLLLSSCHDCHDCIFHMHVPMFILFFIRLEASDRHEIWHGDAY